MSGISTSMRYELAGVGRTARSGSDSWVGEEVLKKPGQGGCGMLRALRK